MTIFFEIAKSFLSSEIQQSHDASVAKDNVILVGHLRNKLLSAAKRELLDRLKLNIDGATPQLNDAGTRDALQLLLHKCLSDLAVKRKENPGSLGEIGESDTERNLRTLTALIDVIYNKLNSLHMIDVEHDHQPFNSVQYHFANYFMQMLATGRNDALSARQETLIIQTLSMCKAIQESENSDSWKIEEIFGLVKNTQLANLDIYRELGIDPQIPKRFIFFNESVAYSEVQLGGGVLGIALQAAGKELKDTIGNGKTPATSRQRINSVSVTKSNSSDELPKARLSGERRSENSSSTVVLNTPPLTTSKSNDELGDISLADEKKEDNSSPVVINGP